MKFKLILAVLSAFLVVGGIFTITNHKAQPALKDASQTAKIQPAAKPHTAPNPAELDATSTINKAKDLPNQPKLPDEHQQPPADAGKQPDPTPPETLPDCSYAIADGDYCHTTSEENDAWSDLKALMLGHIDATHYQLLIEQHDNPDVIISPDEVLLTFPTE